MKLYTTWEVNEADDEVDDDDDNDGNTRPKQLWQRVRRSALFDFKNHDIGTPKRVISTQNHLSKVVAILRTSTKPTNPIINLWKFDCFFWEF